MLGLRLGWVRVRASVRVVVKVRDRIVVWVRDRVRVTICAQPSGN